MMVMVDECHAAGFIERQEKERRGQRSNGKGIITGTLESQWSNGWIYHCQKEIIELLRQRSRPYLFSNS
jgi:7-keto-8-aminopelargonate synthetase-like enzyme